MEHYSVLYLPVGVATFDMQYAQQLFEESRTMLLELYKDVICPPEILLSPKALSVFLQDKRPNLIILQNVTFANAAYAAEVIGHKNVPLVLWTLREPISGGGRLRLNSLTGAFSAANRLYIGWFGRFEYVYGNPKEVRAQLKTLLRVSKLCYQLKHLRLAQIGYTPAGFGFGRASDEDMLQHFGVHLESIEIRQLIAHANAYSPAELEEERVRVHKAICGLERIPKENMDGFLRLLKAYTDYVHAENIGALASRCWPDYFTDYGTPVCAVLGMLNDDGIAASCEADAYGALSMYVGMQLSEMPVFFGDPVSVDEVQNTMTFWHCGTAACSLSREDTGACAGLHCNRGIGPTLDFGCKPAPNATVFRIGRKADGHFRMYVQKGEILDAPKQFVGTSIVVKLEQSVRDILEQSIYAGWEPHFVVAYGDISEELRILSQMQQLELSC